MMRHSIFLVVLLVLYLPAAVHSAPQDEWKRVLSEARKEGKVVLGTNQANPRFRQRITDAARSEYGIEVELRVLKGAELSAVAGRECAANHPSMDVLLSGNSEILSLYPKGCLAELKPDLLLPSVTNPHNWRKGVLKWTDPKDAYLLQTAEPLYGSIAVNSDLIKRGEIRKSADLLDAKYKGKIASYDPRRGGAGQSDATYLVAVLGEEFVRRLFLDQKVVYTADHRELAGWVARGVYPIGLGTVERAVEPLRKNGMPIAMVPFEDAPGYLTGGSSVIKRVKNAPHPNAATVLVNLLASKEGQQAFTDIVGQPSRRTDVSLAKVPKYRIPHEGVAYLDTYAYDFYAKRRPKLRKRLIELLGR